MSVGMKQLHDEFGDLAEKVSMHMEGTHTIVIKKLEKLKDEEFGRIMGIVTKRGGLYHPVNAGGDFAGKFTVPVGEKASTPQKPSKLDDELIKRWIEDAEKIQQALTGLIEGLRQAVY